MEVLDILLATRKMLALPERWTKGSNARKSNGAPCTFASDEAVQFCLNGAMQKVFLEGEFTAPDLIIVTKTVNLLIAEMWAKNIPDGPIFALWNDFEERTHEEVIELLDKVIAVAMLEELIEMKAKPVVERELERI